MVNLTGIISILFLVSVVFYLIKTTHEFEFHKYTVSQLGILPKTKYVYMVALLVYTFLRLIFFSALFTRLGLWSNVMIISSFAIAFCSFIATAFITLSVHQLLHKISAVISWIFTVVLIFLLGIQLLQSSLFLGITNIILANSMLWGSWLIRSKKGSNGYFQLYFICNLIIWDSLMMVYLFGLIK